MTRQYTEQVGHLVTLLGAEQERNAHLLDRLETMQRAGFTAVDQSRYTDTTPDLPPDVLTAILARSPGLGSDLARRLTLYATTQIREGAASSVVADSIWGEHE